MKYLVVYSMLMLNNTCTFGNMCVSQDDIGNVPVKSQAIIETLEATLTSKTHYKCTIINIIPLDA